MRRKQNILIAVLLVLPVFPIAAIADEQVDVKNGKTVKVLAKSSETVQQSSAQSAKESHVQDKTPAAAQGKSVEKKTIQISDCNACGFNPAMAKEMLGEKAFLKDRRRQNISPTRQPLNLESR